jgi:3-deoxy-7-phosphoheptulonate synthase
MRVVSKPGEHASGSVSLRREIQQWHALPAFHQPNWAAHPVIDRVRLDLAGRPGLVEFEEVRNLRTLLAEVAAGRSQVIQAGDCAEDPAECTPGDLTRKIGLLTAIAEMMTSNAGKPVIRVGRFAGQFAKPRSDATERVNGLELPTYAGHMVNSPEPDPRLRRPDPRRMLDCYDAAQAAMEFLRRRANVWTPQTETPVWSSHEALVLDYEVPLVRQDAEGNRILTSTHWPWIGNRTRQPGGAHVALLATVTNPIACKVGPDATAGELIDLCATLDPDRQPGRLTFISRMSAAVVADRLPPLVAAVRAEGHPVSWLCDPMHGNTVVTPDGFKTRLITSVVSEVRRFQTAVAAGGGIAGGLHLETTPDQVTECVHDETELGDVGTKYTTFCDPRLNPEQAVGVAKAWRR